MKVQIKKVKRSVIWRDDGFTLLEALFAVAILSIIVSFIPAYIASFERFLPFGEQELFEWELFVNQASKEIHSAKSLEIHDNKLYISNHSTTSIYEKYNQVLRRQVDGTGHEVILQKVKMAHFSLIKNGVLIKVETITGKQYQTSVYSYIGNE